MSEYYLTIAAIGNFKKLPLTEQEYCDILIAKQTLKYALSIEKKFEIVIRNFYELEKESLCIALKRMINVDICYDFFLDTMISIDTRISNFLSSTRAYIDQVPKDYSESFDNDYDRCADAILLIQNTKDSDQSFHFVESLRNHVQHNGLPTSIFTAHSAWDDEFEHLEYCNLFYIDKEQLKNDSRFNKGVLNKLPDKIELLREIRKYVSALGLIHKEIRKQLAQRLIESRELIQNYIDQYAAILNKEPIGLSAIHRINGETASSIPVFLDWDDMRKALEKKNYPRNNLVKQHVTSRLSKK